MWLECKWTGELWVEESPYTLKVAMVWLEMLVNINDLDFILTFSKPSPHEWIYVL